MKNCDQLSDNELIDRVYEVHRQVPVMDLGGDRIKQVIQSADFEDYIGFS